MAKKILWIMLLALMCLGANAQSSDISKSTAIITLSGYLHVFPEDIGEFSSESANIIAGINKQVLYGYGDWRLPSIKELELMKANGSKLGLQDSDYMNFEKGSSGMVRLVTTGKTVPERAEEKRIAEVKQIRRIVEENKRKREEQLRAQGAVLINGIWWASCNVGASFPDEYGSKYTFDRAQNACPTGWRVPTVDELEALAETGSTWITINNREGHIFGSGSNTLFLPVAEVPEAEKPERPIVRSLRPPWAVWPMWPKRLGKWPELLPPRGGNVLPSRHGMGLLLHSDVLSPLYKRYYWSATPDYSLGFCLALGNDYMINIISHSQAHRFSVRCVAE